MTVELAMTVLVATGYAAFISFGYGRAMDDEIVTRPLIVAGGVLIVIIGYSWSKNDAALLVDLLLWFTLCAIPLMVRGAVIFLQQRDSEAHDKEQAEVARHTVKGQGG